MPVNPAPTMATSASASPVSGSPGSSEPGTVSCQNDSFRYLSAARMRNIVAGVIAAPRVGHPGHMTAAMGASVRVPAPRHESGPYRVCLVCLGNICRSPMAEVILRDELDQAGLSGLVEVDSAGTGDWH